MAPCRKSRLTGVSANGELRGIRNASDHIRKIGHYGVVTSQAAGEATLLVLVTGLPGTGKSTIADHAGRVLPATVLSHDWAMSGLRPFPELESAIAAMQFGNRQVGWSILRALGRAELRRGRSVVLDGVARAPDIEACRSLAEEEHADILVVQAVCSSSETHRARVEGRRRGIPGWYEITWANVSGSAETWEAIEEVDVTLDAVDSLDANYLRLEEAIESRRAS